MNIQSVSIDVPAPCPNNCKFCVSLLAKDQEKGMMHNIFTPEFLKDYLDNGPNTLTHKGYMTRLEYLRDCNINTVILTGSRSEPLFNKKYLNYFFICNKMLSSPFKNIELQTSGVGLKDLTNIDFYNLKVNGVQTIALSLSSLDSVLNQEINEIPPNLRFDIKELCQLIKSQNFNLRLNLNLNGVGFPKLKTCQIDTLYQEMDSCLAQVKQWDVDQLTFRELYYNKNVPPSPDLIYKYPSPQNDWIFSNCRFIPMGLVRDYVRSKGIVLNKLPFGATKYALQNISTVVDEDCMSQENPEEIRYIILRRNGRLYTRWDNEASLLF